MKEIKLDVLSLLFWKMSSNQSLKGNKMKYMLGDLLAVEEGIIAHQCNMYGVMGAGVARLLANKHEDLEPSYQEYCKEKKPHLGNVFVYVVNKKMAIANCFTQEDICMECAKGQNIDPELRSKIRDTAIKTTTDYHAIETAFNTLYEFYSKRTIYIPFFSVRWTFVKPPPFPRCLLLLGYLINSRPQINLLK